MQAPPSSQWNVFTAEGMAGLLRTGGHSWAREGGASAALQLPYPRRVHGGLMPVATATAVTGLSPRSPPRGDGRRGASLSPRKAHHLPAQLHRGGGVLLSSSPSAATPHGGLSSSPSTATLASVSGSVVSPPRFPPSTFNHDLAQLHSSASVASAVPQPSSCTFLDSPSTRRVLAQQLTREEQRSRREHQRRLRVIAAQEAEQLGRMERQHLKAVEHAAAQRHHRMHREYLHQLQQLQQQEAVYQLQPYHLAPSHATISHQPALLEPLINPPLTDHFPTPPSPLAELIKSHRTTPTPPPAVSTVDSHPLLARNASIASTQVGDEDSASSRPSLQSMMSLSVSPGQEHSPPGSPRSLTEELVTVQPAVAGVSSQSQSRSTSPSSARDPELIAVSAAALHTHVQSSPVSDITEHTTSLPPPAIDSPELAISTELAADPASPLDTSSSLDLSQLAHSVEAPTDIAHEEVRDEARCLLQQMRAPIALHPSAHRAHHRAHSTAGALSHLQLLTANRPSPSASPSLRSFSPRAASPGRAPGPQRPARRHTRANSLMQSIQTARALGLPNSGARTPSNRTPHHGPHNSLALRASPRNQGNHARSPSFSGPDDTSPKRSDSFGAAEYAAALEQAQVQAQFAGTLALVDATLADVARAAPARRPSVSLGLHGRRPSTLHASVVADAYDSLVEESIADRLESNRLACDTEYSRRRALELARGPRHAPEPERGLAHWALHVHEALVVERAAAAEHRLQEEAAAAAEAKSQTNSQAPTPPKSRQHSRNGRPSPHSKARNHIADATSAAYPAQ